MKIGMKQEIDIADEMRSSNLESRAQRTASFASTVTLLEATESNNNRHEGVDGHCRRNDVADFGIARAQCGILRTECAQRALRAPLPC